MAVDEGKPSERSSLLLEDGDVTFNATTERTKRRRVHIRHDKNGEHTLHMALVVEDFRVGFYITTIAIFVVGIILTKAFTKGDYGAIIRDVYGGENVCVYFDFPPSTYVLPVLWCFAIMFGFLYSVTAIFRIIVAYLEKKLSRCECVLLIIAYVYINLSILYFMQAFAVQPDRAKPETMIIHTASYLNLKVMFGLLQVVVTYFGTKVSWVGLELPRWFKKASVVHACVLIVFKIISIVWIVNALGDMGDQGLVGRGLWWGVRSRGSQISGWVFVNVGGMLGGIILPLLQALFISRHGVRSHTLNIAVSDNRESAVVNHGQAS